MPVHDWSRIDANLFHHFHQAWTLDICHALNGGLLPTGYSALVEQHAGGVEPDVLTLESRRPSSQPVSRAGGTLLLAPPPQEWKRIESLDSQNLLARRANRITIRHLLGRVVCVMEIVSPGNKSSQAALAKLVEKTVDFLESGVHVLVVDLLPPTPRDPQGIHKAIWDQFEDQPFELPLDKRLTLASYVATAVKTAYVHPVAVGDVLPDMPAWLDEDSYVPVPLEATYQAAWASCPQAMREFVELGELADDESE
jgi:hypothetical protein